MLMLERGDPHYIKVVQSKNIGASLKHFAGNSQELRRMTSDSVIDERTLREIYLPALTADMRPRQIKCDKPNSLAKRLKSRVCELCGAKTDEIQRYPRSRIRLIIL